jgi:hypothetical protein
MGVVRDMSEDWAVYVIEAPPSLAARRETFASDA